MSRVNKPQGIAGALEKAAKRRPEIRNDNAEKSLLRPAWFFLELLPQPNSACARR
jgi:hypothetical protein